MKTSDKGRKFIESFEGLILGAYDDHNDHIVQPGQHVIGVLTIGYGHTDAAGLPTVAIGDVITQQQADEYLANDLAKVEEEVNSLVKVPLTQDQFDALVSFQFNTGSLGYAGNSLLAALRVGDYSKAADAFLLYNHDHGKVLAGLTRRRIAERAMFLSVPIIGSLPNKTAGPTSAAVIVATTGAATVAAGYHSPLIFLGILAAAVGIGLVVHYFTNRKVN